MKNFVRMMVLTAFIPVAVLGQSSKLDEEVNAELDRMYQEQLATTGATANSTGNGNQTQVTTQVTVPVTVQSQQQAEQASAQQQLQKQPLTVIEAAPLTDSKAEVLRKNRQDAELATELTIVEKLEQSRLEDEKRRAEALFGDKFNSMMENNQKQNATAVIVQQQEGNGQQTAVIAVEQAASAPAAAPAVVEVVAVEKVEDEVSAAEKAEMDRDLIRGEVSAALAELKQEEPKKKSSTYVAGIIGAGDYPDAQNVRGQYALGFEVGQKFENKVIVAGSFLYSNYQVEQRDGGCYYDQFGQYNCFPRITDMNQYSTSAVLKYQLFNGSLKPEVGGLVSYTYRTFTDSQFGTSDQSVSSQAFDMGLLAGAAVDLDETFSLGFDFRYMWNLSARYDNSFQQTFSQPGLRNTKPIEQINYYTLGVSARASF